MAKKKHSTTTTTTITAATAKPRKEGAAPPAMDPSPEKLESLKSLNHLLLKETVELREQVSQLRSRIDDLAFDHSILFAVGRDVDRLVLSSYLADLRSRAAASEVSADAKARDLESSLASMAVDRDAAKKEVKFLQETANSLSEALKQADEKLNLAARGKEETENHLDSVIAERNSIRKDLDRKGKALAYLESKVRELEISNSEIKEAHGLVRIKNDESSELVKRKEEALQLVIREKNATEVELEEQRRLVTSLEKNMEEGLKEKQAAVESLVAEKKVLEVQISAVERRYCCVVEKNQQLHDEAHSLKEAVNLLKKDVKSKLTEMGKCCSIFCEDHERHLMEFCEKQERQLMQLQESYSTETLKEFEHLRQMLKEIQEEKALIEGLSSDKHAEVIHLKNELEKLQSDILDSKDECRNYSKINNNLRADKQSIQKALDLEKLVTSELKSQVKGLKKIEDGKERELRDAKTNSEAQAEKIEGLSRELELLQLALVKAEEKKGRVWTWLYPVITTGFAAVSFAYATRGR